MNNKPVCVCVAQKKLNKKHNVCLTNLCIYLCICLRIYLCICIYLCIYLCMCVYMCVHYYRLAIKYHQLILQANNYIDLWSHNYQQNKQTRKPTKIFIVGSGKT